VKRAVALLALLAAYWAAAAAYRPWKAVEPDLAAAHLRLAGDDFRRGRIGDAIAESEKAARLAPSNPVAHYNLACFLVEGKRFDEAARELRRTLELAPGFAPAAELLGRLP
jgi:Flp pilus assembly protein TadD